MTSTDKLHHAFVVVVVVVVVITYSTVVECAVLYCIYSTSIFRNREFLHVIIICYCNLSCVNLPKHDKHCICSNLSTNQYWSSVFVFHESSLS